MQSKNCVKLSTINFLFVHLAYFQDVFLSCRRLRRRNANVKKKLHWNLAIRLPFHIYTILLTESCRGGIAGFTSVFLKWTWSEKLHLKCKIVTVTIFFFFCAHILPLPPYQLMTGNGSACMQRGRLLPIFTGAF